MVRQRGVVQVSMVIGRLMVAYDVLGDRAPLPAEQLFEYRGNLYGFVAVRLSDYTTYAHPISPSWDTVAMPTAEFRRLARPMAELLAKCSPASSRHTGGS